MHKNETLQNKVDILMRKLQAQQFITYVSPNM